MLSGILTKGCVLWTGSRSSQHLEHQDPAVFPLFSLSSWANGGSAVCVKITPLDKKLEVDAVLLWSFPITVSCVCLCLCELPRSVDALQWCVHVYVGSALIECSKHSLYVQWEAPLLADYLTSKFIHLGQNTTLVMLSAVPLVFIMPSGIATLTDKQITTQSIICGWVYTCYRETFPVCATSVSAATSVKTRRHNRKMTSSQNHPSIN